MDHAHVLIGISVVFLIGLIAEELSQRAPIPRVTTMIACGIVLGPSVLNWLPIDPDGTYELISKIALTMIGFYVGGTLTRSLFSKHGLQLIGLSLVISLGTAVFVFVTLRLIGVPMVVAILLAGISTSTDPAAVFDTVRHSHGKGELASTLTGIVALDDVWGLLIFSVCLTIAELIVTPVLSWITFAHAAWEMAGAVGLGILIGLPMSYLTGRIRPGEPTEAEALAMVFFTGGIALLIGVSYLLAAMVLGAVVVNLAKHHQRPFHSIEAVEWPFLMLFFVLSGASLQIDQISAVGMVGVAYIVCRLVGRALSGLPGAWWAGSRVRHGSWVGVALLPQAGVALGMALIGADRFPEHGQLLMAVVISATVFFELLGPLMTRLILRAEQPPCDTSKA